MKPFSRFIIRCVLLACVTLTVTSGGSAFGQVALVPYFEGQYFDNSGNPVALGKVCTFSGGTTTPLASYTDATGGTPNANPVVLDAAGRANIWLTNNVSYKLILYAAGGNSACPNSGATIKSVDGIITTEQAVIGSGTANRVSKYITATTIDDGSIQDLYSGERIRIQTDGTVSVGTTGDTATGLHIATAVGEVGRFGTTTGTSVVTMYGSSGGVQTLMGQLAASSTEFDVCSAAGPCNSGFGVFSTYTTNFSSDPLGLRVISTAGTSGLGMYTSSTYRGGLTANATNISLCSGTGPCASYLNVGADAISVNGTSSTVFVVATTDATSVRQQWNYATSSTAGNILGNSTGLVLTGASAIDLVGTSTNVLDIITSNATNTVRFYSSTSTQAGFIAGNSTELDLCSTTGPCSGGVGVRTDGAKVTLFGGGNYGASVGTNGGSGGLCIQVAGIGNVLLSISAGNFVNGGACPW